MYGNKRDKSQPYFALIEWIIKGRAPTYDTVVIEGTKLRWTRANLTKKGPVANRFVRWARSMKVFAHHID